MKIELDGYISSKYFIKPRNYYYFMSKRNGKGVGVAHRQSTCLTCEDLGLIPCAAKKKEGTGVKIVHSMSTMQSIRPKVF